MVWLNCLALAVMMILSSTVALRGMPRAFRSTLRMSTVRTMEVAQFGQIVKDDNVRKVQASHAAVL